MAGWLKESGVSGVAAGTTLVLGSIAAGRMIRVQVRIGAIGATVSCADDKDGAYTLAKAQADAADNTLYEFFLYPTVFTGSRTVTITTSAGTCRIIASWFTVPTGTTAVAASTTNAATGSGTSVASGNVTAVLGDLVAGAADNTNSVGTGWTAGGTSAGGSWATDQSFNAGTPVVYSQYVVATAGGTFASTPVYDQADSLASSVVVYNASVGGGAPVNTVAPAVTGTTTVGQTLTTTNGTWTGDTSSGFAYQWKDGAGNIAGATSSTYVIGAGENGRSIRCTVTATGTGGSTPQDSNTVGPIVTPDAPTLPPRQSVPFMSNQRI